MQIRVPPAAPVAPPPQFNKNFNAPPAGFQPAQLQSPSPPAPPVDDIGAHGSYPIVKSAEIEFDLDSQGNRIELGRGVFKAVYRGRFFGTPVAVRFFSSIFSRIFSSSTSLQINMLLEESASESDKQEFLRECNVLSNLRHGNIIGLLGACTDSKKCFLLTELMHNGTLFQVLHEKRVQLTTKQRQDIVLGMLMGMNNMHMRRVYHRDLKSANILIDAHFTPKIADFGFAKQKSAAKAKELFQSKVGLSLLRFLIFPLFATQSTF
jgi:serine/threonine protein kinase